MARAIWNGKVIAESDVTETVEGNIYFPEASLKREFFRPSSTTSTCPWKGQARYFSLLIDGQDNPDAAWYYPDPKPAARKIKGFVAFWRGVDIENRIPDRGEGMRVRLALLAPCLAVALASCSTHRVVHTAATTAPPFLTGDPAHPGVTQGWVDTRLYFGLGPFEHPEQGISDARWRDFLDREVTPRFPSGLSVVDAYGQWQGKQQISPERLRTRMLIILYPDSQENRDKIDAIRAAWKQMTGDQSVLRVNEPADVSF